MRSGTLARLPMGKAAAAAFFVFTLVATGTGCGKTEAPSSRGVPPVGQGAGSPAGNAADVAKRSELSMAVGSGISIIVAPSTPSRIAPPSVSVKSPPGQVAEIIDVKWLVNGKERETGNLLSAAAFQRGDRIQAVVKLRAGGGEKVLASSEVFAVNALPTVTEVRIEPQAPTNGSAIRAVVQARDPDGDPLTIKHKWHIDELSVSGSTDSLTLKGIRKGSWVHVAATPNDGFADGAWKYSSRHQVVNGPPVVKNPAPTSIPSSRVLTHTIVAEDPDGDPLTYALVKGPEGIVLSGTTFTWKVSDQDLDKPAEIVIRISDDDGASTLLTMTLNPRKP